jgi:limonene-1,2-epoxide hydrolase
MTEHSLPAPGVDAALVVERALLALQRRDFGALEALLADDVVYVNVGLPATRGRARVMWVMRSTERIGLRLQVKLHRNVADGSTVLNERTDAMVLGPLRVQFWAYGVFEVHDGRITLWRDYFDFYDFAKGAVRGLIGAVVPALRASMP